MNKYKIYLKLIIFLSFNFNIIKPGGFFDYLAFGSKKDKHETKLIITQVDEKKYQLNILKKEKDNLLNTEQEFIGNIQNELNLINKKINEIKEKLKEENKNYVDFLNKKLSKLNELSQILIDTQLKRKKILNIIEQHIELLENYLKDPLSKNKTIETKASYDFDTLDKLQNDISAYENDLSLLSEERSSVELSLELHKKESISLDKEIKNKERDQKRFSTKIKEAETSQTKILLTQRGEILDLELQLLIAQKRLNELRIKEEQHKILLINTRIFISDNVLRVLKHNLPILERSLSVNESNVEAINNLLADKKRESTELQAKYSEQIRKLSQEKDKLIQDSEKLCVKYKANNLKGYCEWNMDFNDIEYEPAIYEFGYLNDRIMTLERNIALLEAQRDFEKEKIRNIEILSKIVTFWYKVSQKKFKSEEEIESEKKEFLILRDELNHDLTVYKEKLNVVTNILNNQARIHINIIEKLKSLNDRSEKYISTYSKDIFNKSLSYLKKSELQIKRQIDIINKITENYSNAIANVKESLHRINNILAKVENISGVLFRSKYAISFENIENISPDLQLFANNLKDAFLTTFTLTNIKHFLDPIIFSKILLHIILLCVLFIFFKKLLPYIYSLLLTVRPAMSGLFFVNCLFALIIGFIISNFLSIFIWLSFFTFIKIGIINDLNIQAIFFIFSIPYLCYLSHKFVKYLVAFNKKQNYLLLSANFVNRFVYVFLFFIYSTIIIFFFIEAFLSLVQVKSELPTILLAIYSIIFRASLIFLIGKEEVLSLIPDKTIFAQWLKVQIDKFYYVFLMGIVALLIISDPYVGGFSRLVSFVLWGIFYTILLITAVWWLQVFVRKVSSVVFFKSEEDEDAIVKERFIYSKTFYGFFSVLSFLFFFAVIVYLGSKIWGVPISFDKIREFTNATIFHVRGDSESDPAIPITLNSFLILFIFLFFGFIIAWAFEKFILRRIFNILLVDQGVQNTVSNVSYYLIVIVILLVGLLKIGLGGLIPFLLGALAVGFAFAIKGPANDLIGYFIILLERSVKIGDYVEMDDNEFRGVVRKITPRSVILRKKNSTSVIIPNSKITSSPFFNWNYTSGFVAIDDIILTVPFSVDPKFVSKLLIQTVSANENVLKSPQPIVRLTEFSENGYTFMARGFLSSINVLNKWDIASDIRIAIVNELRKHNIQIASPTRYIVTNPVNKILENLDK